MMTRRVLYWLAVLVISLAIVVAVILFFASRDTGSLDRIGAVAPPQVHALAEG
jgi:hypothetical protein